MARLTTTDQAAAWVDRVGVALLYPSPDYVLPSLWEAVAGRIEIEWAIREADGKFVSFTPEMEKVWRWKDELPARKLACVGLHLARTSCVVAPRLVAPPFSLTGRSSSLDDFGDVEGLEREIAHASLEMARLPRGASCASSPVPRSASATARSTPSSGSSC